MIIHSVEPILFYMKFSDKYFPGLWRFKWSGTLYKNVLSYRALRVQNLRKGFKTIMMMISDALFEPKGQDNLARNEWSKRLNLAQAIFSLGGWTTVRCWGRVNQFRYVTVVCVAALCCAGGDCDSRNRQWGQSALCIQADAFLRGGTVEKGRIRGVLQERKENKKNSSVSNL